MLLLHLKFVVTLSNISCHEVSGNYDVNKLLKCTDSGHVNLKD